MVRPGQTRVDAPGPSLEPPGFPSICPGRARPSRSLERLLSHSDAVACLELIHRSLDCEHEDELSELVGTLGNLIDADYSACLLSSRAPSHATSRIRIVGGTFPSQWLTLYGERQFHRVDPIVEENFTSFSLQYWADTYSRRPPPREFIHLAEDFGLSNGFTYGVRAGLQDGGSLFSFSGPNLKSAPRNKVIQDLVLPHLHRALCQLDSGPARLVPGESLSERELEVLKWIGVGKSSWETGMILQISERTVNFHIKNIVRKLDAVNRPQAVAMALKLGLLQLP
jgi:LuxR family transcriptional regulator, quorum-sensing system regulator CviR